MTKKSKLAAFLAAILIAVLTACGVSAAESTAATMQAVIAAAASLDEGSAADAYTMQDVSTLCDVLLTKPPQKDLSEKHYDLNGDGVWNAADLCIIKSSASHHTDIHTMVLPRSASKHSGALYFIRLLR